MWQLGAVANLVIMAAYTGIFVAIVRPLVQAGQLRSNRLGAATAAIFLTCAVHHGGHVVHMLLPYAGLEVDEGLALRQAFNWHVVVWDVLSAAVGVYYWTLRRTYGSLMQGAKLFEDLEDQRRREAEAAAARFARLADESRRQASLLAAVLDRIGDGVAVTDPDGRFLLFNPAATRLLGCGPPDQGPATWPEHWGLFRSDGTTAFPADELPLVRALRGETVEDAELVVRNSQVGAERHLSISARPLDPAGGQAGAVVAFHDITERKRHQAVLARQVAALAQQADLLDLAHDAVIIRDQDGRITYCNRQAEAMYGWSRPELAGRVIHEVFQTVFPTSRQAVERSLLETGYWDGELVHTCRDGSQIIVHSRQAMQQEPRPEQDERDGEPAAAAGAGEPGGGAGAGEPVAVIEINSDITARRRAEAQREQAERALVELNADLERRVRERTAELEEQARELQASNAELESFSYSVSHDLRAPLRAMNGFTRILTEEHGDSIPAPGLRYLGKIRESAQQMGELVDALLSFSRLQRQPLDLQPVPVDALAMRVWEDLAADREGRRVELVVGELPPCRADPRLVRQVLTNLVGNALKYSRGRDPAHIEVGACLADGLVPAQVADGQVADGQVVYYVRDDGAGFDMRYADKLFQVFQRLHRAEDFEGTGVGLALVHRIVHRHGGRVWAEGRPGQGATFYFTLPQEQDDEPQRDRSAAGRGQPERPRAGAARA